LYENYDISASDRTTYTISGTIVWEHDDLTGVNSVEVKLVGPENQTVFTNSLGEYSFTVSSIGTYTISAKKGATFNFNGVTSDDATAIQQHLTGSNYITDFFKLVASDCNKSSTISSVDAALIRQGLIGNQSALNILNTTGSWRFIPSDYSYPIPAGPYSLPAFPTTKTVVVNADVSNINFIGVKVGDVNGTANPQL